MKYKLNIDVTVNECPGLDRDLRRGKKVKHTYKKGATYHIDKGDTYRILGLIPNGAYTREEAEGILGDYITFTKTVTIEYVVRVNDDEEDNGSIQVEDIEFGPA